MGEVAAEPAGRRLFVRQSSGLVRDVSVTNALFFNAAAFMGTGVGWYPAFYSLAFVPIGVAGFFTTYGWAAIIVGVAGIFLALIFASLSSVMPRSGGDYVFTTRLIPGVGPFLGWLESFTLVFASLAIVAFEVPVVLRTLQISGRIIGIGTGSGFFERANNWYAEEGVITGWPGFIASLVVLGLILLVVIQPTRRLHKIVTALAATAVLSAVLMWVFGLIFIQRSSFEANLPTYANVTADQLRQAAADNGVAGTGVQFISALFPFVMAIVLLNYIGYQYSAYIAGEVRGNIRRGILIAVLGALVIAVLTNSVFVDSLTRNLGLEAQLGWGVLFWSGDPSTPLGQVNTLPLTATISRPGLWPVWLLISLGGVISPFVLCPAYINFISRITLAWSLDRQVPEWFGRVNERLRAPINAILTAVGVAGVLVLLQNFPILPDALAPPEGKLNLVATLWFSILMALLTWVMPGVNAVLARFTRPALVRNAPWRGALPVLGVIWLAFSAIIYWFAGIDPIADAIGVATQPGAEESLLGYLNRSGITFTLAIAVIAVVIYVVQNLRNRAAGVDTSMLYSEIPPD
jgi:basic amino acid/polyamine antiporter, APA family